MRKLFVTSLVLAAAAALAVAATATGASLDRRREGRDPRLRRRARLNLVEDGVLTIGADNPAFPPWFGGAEKTKPWKVSDPYSGKGYESAVAYAVARQLGFAKSEGEVDGRAVHELVPPGQEAVRLRHHPDLVHARSARRRSTSRSRTTSSTRRSSAARASRSRRRSRSPACKPFKLGAQVGTTSYNYIKRFIRPSSSPLVYDTNDAAVQALKNGQIDGIVVDLPTAFYVTAVQVDDGVIVGKLPTKRHEGALRDGASRRATRSGAASTGRSTGSGANGTIKKLQTRISRAPARPT